MPAMIAAGRRPPSAAAPAPRQATRRPTAMSATDEPQTPPAGSLLPAGGVCGSSVALIAVGLLVACRGAGAGRRPAAIVQAYWASGGVASRTARLLDRHLAAVARVADDRHSDAGLTGGDLEAVDEQFGGRLAGFT